MTKPTFYLDWTDGSASKVEEPTAAKKLLGYVANERPSFKHHNWIFWATDQWIKYFEDVTDTLLLSRKPWDAMVSATGGTHTTLQAAINAVTPYSRIIVFGQHQISTTIIVNKPVLIYFHPSASLENNGAGTGVQVSSVDVSFNFGVFKNFTTAISITAGSHRCRILNCYFSGNTTNVSVAGGVQDTLKLGNIPFSENTILGGGGGGGSLSWESLEGQAPEAAQEFNAKILKFDPSATQYITTYVRVPIVYYGAQIKLYIAHYSPDATGSQLIKCKTYLKKLGSQASNETNFYVSTNSQIVPTSAYQILNSEIDLTDTNGKINNIAVAPYDLLRIELYADSSSTTTDDIRVIPTSTDIKFL
jgi:hypothetical protein